MHRPPPQAALIGVGLLWNYIRSRRGKRTISMWARRHRYIAVPAVILGCCWLVPHWWHD